MKLKFFNKKSFIPRRSIVCQLPSEGKNGLGKMLQLCCWAFGYLARDCKVPYRPKSCLNSGDVRHKCWVCPKDLQCISCANVEGSYKHPTGSFRSPANKVVSNVASREKWWTIKNEDFQLNLNNYEAAQDLMLETFRDLEVEITIQSEQYKDIDNVQPFAFSGTSLFSKPHIYESANSLRPKWKVNNFTVLSPYRMLHRTNLNTTQT